jgi:hypothetical protein
MYIYIVYIYIVYIYIYCIYNILIIINTHPATHHAYQVRLSIREIPSLNPGFQSVVPGWGPKK